MTTGDHAMQRAKERYGMDLTLADLDSIASCIQQNYGKLIGYGDNNTTIWKLKWRKTWLRLVMDKSFYVVITFLPPQGPVHRRWDGCRTERKRSHV